MGRKNFHNEQKKTPIKGQRHLHPSTSTFADCYKGTNFFDPENFKIQKILKKP